MNTEGSSSIEILCVARGLKSGGVLYMISSTVKALHAIGVKVRVLTDPASSVHLQNFGVDKKICIVIKAKHKISWDTIASYLFIRKYIGVRTILFYTKNTIPLTHRYLPHRKWLFIHDLASFHPYIHAYPLFDTLFMKLMIGHSTRIAEKIFAPSQNTIKEILHFFHTDQKKLILLSESTDSFYYKITKKKDIDQVLKKYDITNPFVFYCGSISPRKNILKIFYAFKEIQDQIPHSLYIICGKQGWNNKKENEFLKKNTHLRIHLLPFVTREELRIFYSSASLYLYPSLYEGFGLPILEAQACGCPVLTSTTSSCSEVAGKSAHLVNPSIESEISLGMLSILSDKKYQNQLTTLGYENIKKFSWEKSAKILQKNIEKDQIS